MITPVKLWADVYRPSTLENYVFQNEKQRKAFLQIVKDKDLPNLCFSGTPGSGKTTLAKILIDAMCIDKDVDLLTLNGSDDNSVDDIRDTVKSFAYSYSMSGMKIVFIDEFSYLSQSAQAALRVIIEEVSNTCRFVICCNELYKVIPAIQSRFLMYTFKAPYKDEILNYTADILLQEKVDFDPEDLLFYIDAYYPDTRKLVHELQANSKDGVLAKPDVSDDTGDFQLKIIDLLSQNKIRELRKYICENVPKDEYINVYTHLYKNLNKCPHFVNIDAYEAGIVYINKYMDLHCTSPDAEINMAAFFIELSRVGISFNKG